ncbi:penicillin acylase family protein [Sphingosinicella rhizophila]|uniref:Penicillin acylase family protein n=1 Tax=Sphingosinicella rhizophila TaxID=3050082 RepID=A0ABU3Q519_9SPHN|nr:penicillin acylase family protein [Sphingosinicella sp. GR2756]MDT9598159.1 penicillin acylase family protein [Sphingosinicella sp. GR2756]
MRMRPSMENEMKLFGRSCLGLALAASAVMAPAAPPSSKRSVSDPVPRAGQVSIYRDEWGVPNIYAAREADGFYGLGYALAEDIGESFYLMILAARGELAATLTFAELSPAAQARAGGADAMIENDYQAKLWRIHEEAERSVARLEPRLRDNYEKFAAGVQAFARQHPDKVPAWAPRDVDVADLVAMGHWLLWLEYQAGQGLRECRRGGIAPASFAMVKGDATASRPPTEGFSNQWAVMPNRTATGGAILLSDPHGGINSEFFEYRLHAGGFESAGFSVGPMMLLARNARVGWAMTTGAPDVADCYRVATTSPDNRAYRFDDATIPIENEMIEIKVKGRAPERVPAKYTRHNGVPSPVVREMPGVVYVVSTPYFLNLEGMHNSAYLMNRATDVDGFRDALNNGGMFPQNVLAADTKGDIFYFRAGLTPRRPAAIVDPLLILDGNSSSTSWTGLHPASDQLAIKSPAAGYLQNNNVDPLSMSDPAPEMLKTMPTHLYKDGRTSGQTSRSLAALRALEALPNMTESDAFALATSVKLVDEQAWVEMMKLAVAGANVDLGSNEPLAAFIKDLLNFDGELRADSTSALKYVYFREALRPGLTLEDIEGLSKAFDDPTKLSSRLQARFVGAMETAFARLLKMPKGLQRLYGDEFRLRTGPDSSEPMSGGNLILPQTGINECTIRERLCGTSLMALYYAPPNEKGERFAILGSRIMRLDFYSPQGIRTYSLQNPGQVHEAGSPHSHDQARDLMSKRKLKQVHFDWKDLRDNVVSSVKLHVE